ncbi:MAG: acyl carrier protein [Hydrogenophaga sp.]|uniref:acyl carrier protein n=1 Tax=Hydrogenophaga sp. TaxID=1904254 RepID=UPI0025B827CC|nr:acyl carrier protein [Hydrogenophaga sp.]MBU7574860.1 acyl carrier protein [Hydrogenophaga sp.]
MPEVRALIASVLQIPADALQDDDGAETVESWDSLKTVMLASMIEITYDITLDNSDIERLTSVSAVREVIARHV